MKKICAFIILSFIVCNGKINAQVGIGTVNPDPSAVLDVTSTSKGVLIPRLNEAQKLELDNNNPATGLLIYYLPDNNILVNRGTPAVPDWQPLNCENSGGGSSTCQPVDDNPDVTFNHIVAYNGESVIDSQGMTYSGNVIPASATIEINVTVSTTTDFEFQAVHERSGLIFSATGNLTAGNHDIILENNEIEIPVEEYGTYKMTLFGASNSLELRPRIDIKSIPAAETEVVEVTGPNGKIWMDRNLGASQPAVGHYDPLAYGSLFQWGRKPDGHEIIVTHGDNFANRKGFTGATNIKAAEPTNDLFITARGSQSIKNWGNNNGNLWNGVSAVNNPCPAGFRVATLANYQNLPNWTIVTAGENELAISGTSSRNWTTAQLGLASTSANYWSADNIDTSRAWMFSWSDGGDGQSPNNKTTAGAVRCIKN